MGPFDFRTALNVRTAEFNAIVAHYKRLRAVRFRLNNELTGRLSTGVLKEGANRIGILRDDTFVFGNEDETCVLMDYCIFDVYRNGRNAVEQYLCDDPPDPDSDEMECLRAMQHATFALVAVLRVEPGVGCHVRNLFTEETPLLVDIGFSHSAMPGAVIATRLLDFGAFVTSSGAALPLGVLDDDQLDQFQRHLRRGADDHRGDPAPLIRACLESGASESIRYEEVSARPQSGTARGARPVATSAKRRRADAGRRQGKPLANRRCRCGSGKMVKNCCGKRKDGSSSSQIARDD